MTVKLSQDRDERKAIVSLLLALLAILLLSCIPSKKVKTYPLEWVSLKVRHRLYPNFEEVHKVKPLEFFDVSDTDYRAKVVRFLPDFAIDDSGKVFSRSGEPKNPAVLVEVWLKKKKIDQMWAFRSGSIPHFKASSYLYFEILDFSVPKKEETTEEGDS